jgi:hypothetical protein
MSRHNGLIVIHGDSGAHMPNRAEMLDYLAAMAGELSTLAERSGAETLAGLLDLARREAVQEQQRYVGEAGPRP